jgi:hypothetical protein
MRMSYDLDLVAAIAKGVCISSGCGSIDELVAAFHPYCDESTLFVSEIEAREVGSESTFELRLADDTPAISGWCTVLDAWTDSSNPFGKPGVRLGLRRLTPASERVLRLLQAAKLRMPIARGSSKPIAKNGPPKNGPRTRTVIGVKLPTIFPRRIKDPPAPDSPLDGKTERMTVPPVHMIEAGNAEPKPPDPAPKPPEPAPKAAEPARPTPAPATPRTATKELRTKGMRISTPCATVEEFVAAFHRCCEDNAFFIASRSMRPVGLESAFSVDLTDGTPMVRGLGVVLDAWSTADNRFKKPGVLIGIQKLTSDSKKVFESLQIARALAADEPLEPQKDRRTRQMVAIGPLPPRPATGPTTITMLKAVEPTPLPGVVPARPDSEPKAVAHVPLTMTAPISARTPIITSTPAPLPAPVVDAKSAPVMIAEPPPPIVTPAQLVETAPLLIPQPPQAVEEPVTPPPLAPPPVVEPRPLHVEPRPPSVELAPEFAEAVAREPAVHAPVATPVVAPRVYPVANEATRLWLLVSCVFAVGLAVGVGLGLVLRGSSSPPPAPPKIEKVVVPVIIPTPILVPGAAAVKPAKPAPHDPPPAHVVHPKPQPKPKPAAPPPAQPKCAGLNCL